MYDIGAVSYPDSTTWQVDISGVLAPTLFTVSDGVDTIQVLITPDTPTVVVGAPATITLNGAAGAARHAQVVVGVARAFTVAATPGLAVRQGPTIQGVPGTITLGATPSAAVREQCSLGAPGTLGFLATPAVVVIFVVDSVYVDGAPGTLVLTASPGNASRDSSAPIAKFPSLRIRVLDEQRWVVADFKTYNGATFV